MFAGMECSLFFKSPGIVRWLEKSVLFDFSWTKYIGPFFSRDKSFILWTNKQLSFVEEGVRLVSVYLWSTVGSRDWHDVVHTLS